MERIQFKPLSEGLGFTKSEPPETPKPIGHGSGAVAAGRPKFVHPNINPTPMPAKPESFRPEFKIPTPEKVAPTFTASIEVLYPISYSVKRFFAYAIDIIFNVCLCLTAFSILALRLGLSPQLIETDETLFLIAAFIAIFHWALVTSQEILFETTIGKRMFNLQIKASPSVLFLRSFAFLFSIIPMGLGLWMALFDSQKRCLHDRLADVQPSEIIFF